MTSLSAAAPALCPDLGDDQTRAYDALCQMRLAQRSVTAAPSSLLSRASSLFGKSGAASLGAWVDRATNLSKFKRYGVVPDDFVQSEGMHYKRLRNAYGLAELVDFGFQWHHLLQLGFDVDDLASVTPEEYHALGVTADELARDLPLTAADVCGMKLKAHVLRELKFTFQHFLALGVSETQLGALMTPAELQTYFRPTPEQMSQLTSARAALPARAPRNFPGGRGRANTAGNAAGNAAGGLAF